MTRFDVQQRELAIATRFGRGAGYEPARSIRRRIGALASSALGPTLSLCLPPLDHPPRSCRRRIAVELERGLGIERLSMRRGGPSLVLRATERRSTGG